MSPPDHTPQPDERFEYLIEHLQDAVVQFDLVDGDPIVRAVNPAFTSVFGYDDGDIVGEPLNEFIVPSWLAGEADALDDRTAAGEVNYRRVRRQTAEGLKLFLYRGIPYRDADGGHAGFAVYTDLTERSRRERRLEVVGRVLRHNLRNRVTVLAGAAGQIRDGLEDPPPEVARALDRVDDVAGTLGSVADEAADIHALLEAPPDEAPVVDAAALARQVVGRARERYPDATVETDLPDALAVAATERLGEALDALVENAVVHNHAAEPWVQVAVEPVGDGRWVDIVVADDGPRIPEMEREVVTGDADITGTYHGSGLGLWLAAWTVERFGGDLAFGESARGGNRVRLRLQRAGDDGGA